MKDPQVDLSGFPEAARRFGWDASAKEMQRVFERNESASLRQNLEALSAIIADSDRSPEKAALASRLAKTWITALKQHDSGKDEPSGSSQRLDRKAAMVAMIKLGLDGSLKHALADFISHTLADLQRYDLREVHVAALLELQDELSAAAAKRLRHWLVQLEKHFESFTRQPPNAPADWRRSAATGCSCADCRRVATFLRSASEAVLELPLAAQRRRHLHGQIETQQLDLTHESRRRGSPYVLVCRKATATYQRAVKVYESDFDTLQLIRKLLARSPAGPS